MKRLTNMLALLACLTTINHADEPDYKLPKSEWKTLFNGRDFTGWDKHLATEKGDTALLNVDPNGVFTVVKDEGVGIIRVSGEAYGAITTKEKFDNMHFRLQFKWGIGRFGGRATVGRDTGLLYCGIGTPNPRSGWLVSVENNIMEKGVGQWWSVNGAVIDCEGEWITDANELFIPYKREGKGEQNVVWREGSPRIQVGSANGITPPFDVEYVFGNWNTVEVVFWGGQCFHILNGQVNLVAVNPRHLDGNIWRPLTEGKVQLQSEGAEVYYRAIEVKPIYEIPEALRKHILSPAGDEKGFTPLLTGAAAAHWKQSGAGKFLLKDGVATAEGGMGLSWFTGRSFTNFVLRGEFVQEQADADSGVFVRFPDPGTDPWVAVKQGHEFEIGETNPQNPTWRTGSIYPFQASTTANTKPAGEWNTFEMVCNGHNYSVRINNRVVTTWTDTTTRSLTGHIGLQNYDDGKTVRFRNLRVKDLWPLPGAAL